MTLPGEAPIGMVCDDPAATFFIVGTRGHAQHWNAMAVHVFP